MAVGKKRFKIRYLRWFSVIAISLLFALSYFLDIQLLEGSLVGSRFAGFHLTDPFAAIEVMLAGLSVPVNLLIGMATIVLFYIIIGGRAFCSWVCPYGFLSELGEYAHVALKKRGIIKGERNIPINRYWFWVLWASLSFVTGYLVFETFNLMAITSRLAIYGFSLVAVFILISLIIEIFFFRRFWCKNVCPSGTTYGMLNWVSAGKISWRKGGCGKCGKCIDACYDKSLLGFINEDEGGLREIVYVKGSGCTLCGRCIDECPQGCMGYSNRLKNIV